MDRSRSRTSAGHLVATDVGRAGCRHVHRNLAGEVLEVIGARHEIRLAVHFHEHANLAAHVNVAADEPFVRRTARFLGRLGETALAKNGGRLLDVAVRFGQRRLALHHARAGQVAELLHHRCRDFHRCCHLLLRTKKSRPHYPAGRTLEESPNQTEAGVVACSGRD